MPRPIHAVVHQDALTHNLQVARNATPDSQVFAVVKANAYGHGIERVYPALSAADGFALLDLAEAKRIRALGGPGQYCYWKVCFHRKIYTIARKISSALPYIT